MTDLPAPHHLSEFAQVHIHCISDAIQPSHPLMPSLPALNLSRHQGVFQWVSCLHQVTKILEFQLQHQSFQWVFRLILFKIDWFDLTDLKTLRSLLQHHSLNASILYCSAFFVVQLSQTVHDHWEDHSLDYADLCWQSNISDFLKYSFLPISNHLISWLQSPSAVILKPKKRKSVTASTFSPICPEVTLATLILQMDYSEILNCLPKSLSL